MLEKCRHLDLNVFHLKWIIRPMAIEKMKILGVVLELPARQHCQFSQFTKKMGKMGWIGSANSSVLDRYFCTGQQQLWRGSVNFKINSRPLFTIIFKLKNRNFMTRDFSPLIKRVLAGVHKDWIVNLQFDSLENALKNLPRKLYDTAGQCLSCGLLRCEETQTKV